MIPLDVNLPIVLSVERPAAKKAEIGGALNVQTLGVSLNGQPVGTDELADLAHETLAGKGEDQCVDLLFAKAASAAAATSPATASVPATWNEEESCGQGRGEVKPRS